MFLALSESCPIFDQSAELHLHKFLSAAIDKRHVIVSPSPERLGQILPAYVWRLYGEYLRHGYKRSINSAKWSGHDNCSGCDPARVAAFYSLPLVLVVENCSSDGMWVELLINKLRPDLRWSIQGPQPALDIQQAGGIGEIPKELYRIVDRRAPAAIPGACRRLVALADSDSCGPGGMSASAKAVASAAGKLGVPFHILLKRSIENYIPDEALWAYADKRADKRYAVSYILTLTGPARDYYPMKAGLNGATLATSELFPADSPVGVGLGDFIVDFLDSFSHVVEAGHLRRRDGNGELDSFLCLIEENL